MDLRNCVYLFESLCVMHNVVYSW